MPPAVTAEEIDFRGWDGVRLSNGIIEAVCVPEIGGRLMRFRLGSARLSLRESRASRQTF